MTSAPIDFNGQTWPTSSTDISDERTVNLYPVVGRPNRHALKEVPPIYLYSTEGCTVFSDSGQSTPVRGCLNVEEIGYICVGNTVYSITPAGVGTTLFTIGTSSGFVSIAAIAGTVGFVDGVQGYMYNIAAQTMTQVAKGTVNGNGTVTALSVINSQSVTVASVGSLKIGYTMSVNMDGVNDKTTTNLSSGATVLVVASGVGFVSGGTNRLTLILDNGSPLDAAILNVSGTSITIATALPSSATAPCVVTANCSPAANTFSGTVTNIVGNVVTLDTVNPNNITTSNTYTWTYTSGFPNGVTTIAASDGYFIVTDPGTQNVRVCNLNLPTIWSPADYILASTYQDLQVRAVVYQQNICAFGTGHMEQFFDSGNVLFPFQSERGSSQPFGLAAVQAVCVTSTALAWLSISPRGGILPVMLQGNVTDSFFNAGVIEEMNSFTTYSDAIMFTYVRDSHEMIVLSFPTAKKTYVYDIQLSLAHERESLDPTTLESNCWFPNCYITLGGLPLCGDSRSGKLMQLSPTVYTENGTMIRRRRKIPVLLASVQPGYPMIGVEYKTVNRFEIRFQTSVGAIPGTQGSNPTAMLNVSRDGGHTWDGGMWRSLGQAGQFYDVAIWDGLGAARKWCGELTMTDPVDWKVLEVYADVDDGSQ